MEEHEIQDIKRAIVLLWYNQDRDEIESRELMDIIKRLEESLRR